MKNKTGRWAGRLPGLMAILALAAGLLALALLVSCATPSAARRTERVAQTPEAGIRGAIEESAKSLLGQRPNARVTVRGREFVLDCIGTVNAAYWGAGIDIATNPGAFSGNGVAILYKNLEARGGILKGGERPLPGDIIFWDNTYDRNDNGKIGDDPLTHAGLVISVDNDGTVHYLHEDYTAGVVMAVMNLSHPDSPSGPDGKKRNSGMYMGSWAGNPKNPAHWTAGDLFRALGDAEGVETCYR